MRVEEAWRLQDDPAGSRQLGDGLARRLGRRDLPLLLHPDFWTRRRVVRPDSGGWELPMPSRRGIEEGGFSIIEDRQPSFLPTACC